MIFIFLIIIFLLITILVAGWSSAPFMPTRTEDLPRILKLSNLKPGQKFVDLGCGNGKVVLYIAENTKANVVGIEMAAPIYVWAKIRQLFSRQKNLKVIYKSFFKVDLS
jgi:cyclopropane fatty-acyl-phospholipid synthase-like methyltransferase